MALVQTRTPGGSYSMVDEKLVPVYEAEGWVLTSELPEFKTKNVTYYDEARKTVIDDKGVEKPVEDVIPSMKIPERDLAPGVVTLSERAAQTRNYTLEEWKALTNASLEEKLEMIKTNASNGIRLTPSQKYFLDKQYKLSSSDVNKAQDEGKSGLQQPGPSGPLQPGQAGYGIDTWYEFLGYSSENDAMRDFAAGKLSVAQIKRAEAEIQPDPADIIVDLDKVKNEYNVEDSDWARATPAGQQYLSLLESIEAIENSAFGATPPGQAIINDLKSGTDKDIALTGGGIGNPNLGGGTKTLYIVVGSPGNYTVKAVNPGDEGYESGMSLEASQATADKLNAEFLPDDTGGTGESVETSTEVIDFNNVPKGSKLTEVDGKLYLMYAVPGQGQLYTGNTMYMAYEVVGNDVFAAGLLTEGAAAPTANYSMDKAFFDGVAIVAGNTNQIIGIEDDPFASFVETYSEEAQLRPWLLDPEFIALQAEAAIENRDISDTEWRLTNWYQTHNQAERAWMDLELSDPAEAARQLDDLEIFYENQLSSLGVSGVPDGLVQWISSKNISGQWSDTYTAEQLKLFSDPYKSGDRDAELQNLISTSGFGDVDRTAAREREVVELYRKWLGPTLGSLTQDEVSEIAGRLRDDPDYEDALIQNLKQNRLAAFSNYTNPELTYEDIARPWRNLTTSVWGQTADETQGWWQEMVKTNDFAKAQETLRTKGLEQNVTQVTQDATQALQQALGQGQVSQLGVNV